MNPPSSSSSGPRRLMSRVGYLLNRTALQIRQMAEDSLKPLDLLPPHIAILSTLHSEGPQTQRKLGQLLRIDPTTIVWLIDHLEKKGFVRRGLHPKDRRAHLVELTAAGKNVFQRAARHLDEMEEKFLSPLSATEGDHLRKLLTKLFQSVTTQQIPPKMFKGAGH